MSCWNLCLLYGTNIHLWKSFITSINHELFIHDNLGILYDISFIDFINAIFQNTYVIDGDVDIRLLLTKT